jgi:hypothetical protein
MAIIGWHKENIKVIPILDNNGNSSDNVVLLNGWNDIPDVKWAKARQLVKPLIKKGVIEEKGTIKVKEDGTEILSKVSLRSLQMEEALQTIKDTANIETLRKWEKEETRGEVMKALQDEIKEVLKVYPEKEKAPKVARRKLFEKERVEE